MSRATPTIVAAVLLGLMSPEFGGQAIPAGQPPTLTYNIIDLGTLPDTASCRAYAINDLGKVVGWCSLSPSPVNPRRGFMWEVGVMTNLGGVPGYSNVWPLAVNNLGQIVGFVDNVQSTRAFLWASGIMRDLNDLMPQNSGWELAYAYDINDAGLIVGWGYHDGILRAYLYDGVEIVDLGTLGGNISVAWAINESGKVVGAADTEVGERHAFLWQNGVMTRLGPFDGNYSVAYDINDRGAVVGAFGTITENPPLPPSESRFPFRWEGGVVTELDPADLSPASALAINNQSQVVGSGDRFEGFYFSVAVLWQGNERHELYDLIPPDSHWQIGLGSAQDINEAGQIVGDSWSAPSDGNEHAYLLTPVSHAIPTISEWGTLTLGCLLLGLGCVIIVRVRGSRRGGCDHGLLGIA